MGRRTRQVCGVPCSRPTVSPSVAHWVAGGFGRLVELVAFGAGGQSPGQGGRLLPSAIPHAPVRQDRSGGQKAHRLNLRLTRSGRLSILVWRA